MPYYNKICGEIATVFAYFAADIQNIPQLQMERSVTDSQQNGLLIRGVYTEAM
jgi:hypothetical protein